MAAKSPKTQRTALKRYPGVYTRKHEQGTMYEVAYRRDKRLIWEKVGGDWEGYSAQDAAQIRGDRIRGVRHGQELPRDKKFQPTLGEAWDRYLKWAKRNKKDWAHDKTRWELHLAPTLKDRKLGDIDSSEVEALRDALLDAGKAPATVRQVLVLLGHLYAKADPRAWTGTAPTKGVKRPAVDNARERFLSRAECDLLLADLGEHSAVCRDMTEIALNTLARFGELAALRWQDVDLENAVVIFKNTKNGQTRRIPLNRDAIAVFQRLVQGEPTDLVFTDHKGDRLVQIPSTFRTRADALFNRKLARDDRRHRVTFHTLRHTGASHLAMAGVPLHTLGKLLGHKTPGMTARYSHLLPHEQPQVLNLMARPKAENVIEFPQAVNEVAR